MSEYVVGVNSVEALLTHDPASVIEVLVEQNSKNARVRELEARARKLGLTVLGRSRDALDKVSEGARHQGVAVRCKRTTSKVIADLSSLIAHAGDSALFLLLDGVQDPHNLGACLRSAEAAGATAVVVPRDKAVGITPVVHKASAGAAERVPFVQVANLARAMDELKEAGIWITGLAGEGKESLYDIDLRGKVALVLGGEGEGLRRLTRDKCDHLAKIPMYGGVESLNVSVATGIALFEARRQRGR